MCCGSLYGLVLLMLVWTAYEQLRWRLTGDQRWRTSRSSPRTTFIAFAVLQLITVLLLVPAVFGGAIADEKQRKTLHYLMASQLSSGEIILDKVLGPLGAPGGVPGDRAAGRVLARLFGGISVESVVVAYVGTFSTVAFAVALTVLVSTRARRVRDAIVTSYLLVLGWLLVPPLILVFGSAIRPAAYFWIQPVNDWLADSSPLGAWLRTVPRSSGADGRRRWPSKTSSC